MTEKKMGIQKERFEFKFTVNDNIICQRYFKIDGFNESSKNSLELINALNRCVNLIKDDLSSKTRVYMWHTCPYIFNNASDFNKWLQKSNNIKSLKCGTQIIIKNEQNDFYWDGEELKQHTTSYMGSEYVDELSNQPIQFKLTFIDNGKEVCSRIWDGSAYPKFIRNAVDLSNQRGRMANVDITRMSFDNMLLYKMSSGKSNLINSIIRILCDTCTYRHNTSFTKYMKSNALYDRDRVMGDALKAITMEE